MIRRGLEKRLLLIALAPAAAVALALACYFLALRFSDVDAAGLPAAEALAKKRDILLVAALVTLAALAGAAVVARRLARTVAAPLAELQQALGRIRDGDYEGRARANPDDVLYAFAASINDVAAALQLARQRAADNLIEREEELARQLAFAQAMLDAQAHAGIGLAVVEHGQIVFANEAVERISGYSAAELRALPHFAHLADPQDRGVIMRDHLQRLAGETAENRHDFSLLRKDGTTRSVQLAQASIVPGRWAQVLCILVDISERKRAEVELADAHQLVLAGKEEAERANLAKSRFLAAASHDLRQPLHALTLFAAELETAAATPDQKRLAGQIAAATGAMAELLDALLEVSRLDTADIRPQRQPLALGTLLEGIADAHRQSAAAKGLRLSCTHTDAWIDSDPHLLRRLIGNLVANAIRYTRLGGVVIGARREGDALRIEVHDSGMGIEAEHLPHIFQEFYQAGNSERDMGKGLGLGLAIVERIAHVLGHRLHVRSAPRRGSTFAVTVPRALPPEALAPAPAEQPAPYAARIVVAGAAAAELESLGNLVENWGYRALRAGDERSLRIHMAAMPDAVVCDESLAEALAHALAGRPRPRPQVVLVVDPPAAAQMLNIFFDGRLAKPVKPGRLRALLHHLLEEATEQVGGKAA